MNDTTKEKSSEQKILKNRILNLKKRNYDLKKKNIPMSPYKNQKFFLKRPKSNYIPRINNNILEQSKMNSFNNKINAPNKILVNRKISTSDIHGNNSISFINNSQRRIKNYIYYEDRKVIDKSRINYFKENNIPKSAKNELKISKSFLNNNVTFTKIYSKEIQKGIRGCKSPLNYSFRNKYLDIAKELLGGKKFNKEHRIQNSPSTTNNSNFNDNNSYSSHFLFGKSLMNLNIYPKGINNYFFVDNKYTNKEYKNFGENSKISSPKLNKINKLLLKKEKEKEKENLIKTKESFYQWHLNKQKKNQNDMSQIRNIPFHIGIKSKIAKDISSYMNLDFTEQSKNIIKSSKYIERKKEQNPKRINKKINLIIKYAFLSKAIQDIKRKVDFVNPKNGEKITLNTTNIQNNNENTNNKDFTIVGYEVSPQDVYKLYQNKTKKKAMIKIKKESQTQTKYFNMDNEDKIISPKFFVSQQYEKKLKYKEIKNYRKIEIKKPENKKQKSSGESLDYIRNKKDIIFDINDGIDINNFGLGESVNKNKLNYNMITDNDKKEGKKLWSKIYKSSINIFNKKNSNLNIKSKIDSDLKKIEKIKRIKSAKIKGGKNVKKRKLNQKDTVRRKQKKNFSQKIESLEQHKLMRNEGGFNEIKNEENKIYNIDFKITDESDDDTINEVIAEKRRKEEQEQENIESLRENLNTRNSHKKRNTIVDSNPFNNKLYKIKKTTSKIINNLNKIEAKTSRITHNNKNIKQKDETRIIKNQIPNISYYNKNINKKKGDDRNIKYNSLNINKITKKKTQKEKAPLKNVKSDQYITNILKDNSMEMKDDKIWDQLYSSIDSEYGDFNLSCENKYDNIKYENLIKKSKKSPSALLFDRFFERCRMNKEYKEDEKMEKYFNDIFNKYDNDNELVDIKFFGFDFKIKRKNQINFKNIFMKNIREQNILQRENKIIYTKLALILERFNKTKIKTYKKNLEIYKSSKIKRLQKIKSRIKLKKESKKNKTKVDKTEKNESIEEKKEEFQSQMFLGVKLNSMDEFERKKDEILTLIEDKIRDRVMKGDMGQVEMRKFLDFQKRMNAYQIDKNSKNSFIQLLEQEFISFQERMKIYEQKLKEEKRLNKFLNELNDGFERDFYYKNFHKKMFCNVINYKEKNNINLLSSTKDI